MLIERNNNEVIIKINAAIPAEDIQQLVDYLKYIEIARKSHAKKRDLDKLVMGVKKKRRSNISSRPR